MLDQIRTLKKQVIKDKLGAMGQNQSKLAAHLGTHPSYISQALGGVPVSKNLVERIAAALNCSVEEISEVRPRGVVGFGEVAPSKDLTTVSFGTIGDSSDTLDEDGLDAFMAEQKAKYAKTQG